jgi:hypothetical protein
MRRVPSLALVVPFHNEVRHLPKLLGDGFGELLDATRAPPCTAALANRVRTLFVRHASATRRAGAPSLPARTVPLDRACAR